jgi:hypothetical protein
MKGVKFSTRILPQWNDNYDANYLEMRREDGLLKFENRDNVAKRVTITIAEADGTRVKKTFVVPPATEPPATEPQTATLYLITTYTSGGNPYFRTLSASVTQGQAQAVFGDLYGYATTLNLAWSENDNIVTVTGGTLLGKTLEQWETSGSFAISGYGYSYANFKLFCGLPQQWAEYGFSDNAQNDANKLAFYNAAPSFATEKSTLFNRKLFIIGGYPSIYDGDLQNPIFSLRSLQTYSWSEAEGTQTFQTARFGGDIVAAKKAYDKELARIRTYGTQADKDALELADSFLASHNITAIAPDYFDGLAFRKALTQLSEVEPPFIGDYRPGDPVINADDIGAKKTIKNARRGEAIDDYIDDYETRRDIKDRYYENVKFPTAQDVLGDSYYENDFIDGWATNCKLFNAIGSALDNCDIDKAKNCKIVGGQAGFLEFCEATGVKFRVWDYFDPNHNLSDRKPEAYDSVLVDCVLRFAPLGVYDKGAIRCEIYYSEIERAQNCVTYNSEVNLVADGTIFDSRAINNGRYAEISGATAYNCEIESAVGVNYDCVIGNLYHGGGATAYDCEIESVGSGADSTPNAKIFNCDVNAFYAGYAYNSAIVSVALQEYAEFYNCEIGTASNGLNAKYRDCVIGYCGGGTNSVEFYNCEIENINAFGVANNCKIGTAQTINAMGCSIDLANSINVIGATAIGQCEARLSANSLLNIVNWAGPAMGQPKLTSDLALTREPMLNATSPDEFLMMCALADYGSYYEAKGEAHRALGYGALIGLETKDYDQIKSNRLVTRSAINRAIASLDVINSSGHIDLDEAVGFWIIVNKVFGDKGCRFTPPNSGLYNLTSGIMVAKAPFQYSTGEGVATGEYEATISLLTDEPTIINESASGGFAPEEARGLIAGGCVVEGAEEIVLAKIRLTRDCENNLLIVEFVENRNGLNLADDDGKAIVANGDYLIAGEYRAVNIDGESVIIHTETQIVVGFTNGFRAYSPECGEEIDFITQVGTPENPPTSETAYTSLFAFGALDIRKDG